MAKNNLSNVILTVGFGLISGGFGSTDAITVENEEEAVTMVFGGTGHAVANYNNVDALKVSITLMQTSLAYTIMSATMEAQFLAARAPGPIVPLPFMMVDNNNGDTIAALRTVFTERPVMTKAKGVTEAVFVLSLTGVTQIRGTLNVLQ